MQNAGTPPGAGTAALDPAVRPVRFAPLKDGLAPEKLALAHSLRTVFPALGLGVRRYAARRHLDAATVTRYLNGERVPPWDFIARLLVDIEEAGAPVTPEAEAGLRSLHRAAQKSNRRSSQVQALQDRLEEADEETRRIKTRERALDEALYSRQQSLADAQSRCRRLETELSERKLAHRAEVALWQGEYQRVNEECSDLQEQVLYLQEALAVVRAELIAAEEQCHRLETQLEVLHEIGHQDDDGREDRLTLVAALEAADRTATVPELVAAVGNLESRTRRAMASELVKSASRSREISEVVGLLVALRDAGFDTHAATALPAVVMTRTVADIGVLTCELLRAGLGEYALTLLRTSVELHRPADVAAFALALQHGGLPDYARTLVEAAAAVRPVADVVSLAAFLAGAQLETAVAAAMEAAAAHRSVSDLTSLTVALRHAGQHHCCEPLFRAVAAGRPATDIADLMTMLSGHGRIDDADTVFQAAQEHSAGHLISLLYALLSTHEHDRAWSVLIHAAHTRPITEVAVLIADLLTTDRRQHSAQVLLTALRNRSVPDRQALVAALHGLPPGAEEIIGKIAADSSPEDAAALLVYLNECGFPQLGEVVFQRTLQERPVSHCGYFLASLAGNHARQATADALSSRARTASAAEAAPLLLALASSPRLAALLDAVARTCAAIRQLPDLVQLVKYIRSRDSPTLPQADRPVNRLIGHAVTERAVFDLVALVIALEAAGLKADAHLLETNAATEHGRRFKEVLYRERTKHEQKVLSLSFWRKAAPRHAQKN